jgi:hypothetical protein
MNFKELGGAASASRVWERTEPLASLNSVHLGDASEQSSLVGHAQTTTARRSGST